MWNQDCRRNINSLSYADDTTLMAESEEELKSLLMRVKEESENAGLTFKKQNIQSHHFMVNIRGGEIEAVILFSWVPKSLLMVIAVMKLRFFFPWKESYDKPRQCIQKQRYHFADKSAHSQSYSFPVLKIEP